MQPISLTPQGLDQLLPMHIRVAKTGHIVHAGPTLLKLRPQGELVGARLLELFMLRSNRTVQSINDLRGLAGKRLKLQFRDPPKTGFKGVLANVCDDDSLIFNLSFGISVVEAIHDYNLHAADFAATDLSAELLYLIEAKSAAMNESRKLNQDLQAAKIAAEEQAFTDTLTGLKNRRALSHILERYLTNQQPFAVMQLDLDYFKSVNDSYGHAAGDHVLQRVAEIMVDSTRTDTTLVRAGGDEFILIFPGSMSPKQLSGIAKRLIERIEEPIPFGKVMCRISGSIGISVVPEHLEVTASEVLEEVDQALYSSKNAGRGRATFFPLKAA